MGTYINFLFYESSIIAPKVVTELKENIYLYSETSYFRKKKANAEYATIFIKLNGKNPFKLEKDMQTKSLSFQFTKISDSALGIVENGRRDISFLISGKK